MIYRRPAAPVGSPIDRRGALVACIGDAELTPGFRDRLLAMVARRSAWDDARHAVLDLLAGYMDLADVGGESHRALLALSRRIREIQ